MPACCCSTLENSATMCVMSVTVLCSCAQTYAAASPRIIVVRRRGRDAGMLGCLSRLCRVAWRQKARRKVVDVCAHEYRVPERVVDIQDSVGWCALHYAAQVNSYSSCKLLLDNGATVDIQDVYGNTPLSKAVFNSIGNGEVVELLRLSGADINLNSWQAPRA